MMVQALPEHNGKYFAGKVLNMFNSFNKIAHLREKAGNQSESTSKVRSSEVKIDLC